ncbi:MAG: LysM peptidoglycan-binding domain-containing protein, partial [Lachnospiraceae bacterium]|nr:LysM peptidoglycan-binding domain-containing protein [Lachnospiraceae bacterium]
DGVTIDFSALDKGVDTVEIAGHVVKTISEAVNVPNNDAKSLEIILTNGTSVKFDAKALAEKSAQAGGFAIIISIKYTTNSTLTGSQLQTIGDRPALDISVMSGGKHISDMGGTVTLSAPYELRFGEKAEGIVVYYVDDNGSRERCETSYDPVKKCVNWKTDHLSVYMIDYEEPKVTLDMNNEILSAYEIYSVRKGDTLWKISKKYGCTISGIVSENHALIKNPNLIYAGWQLKIPQK